MKIKWSDKLERLLSTRYVCKGTQASVLKDLANTICTTLFGGGQKAQKFGNGITIFYPRKPYGELPRRGARCYDAYLITHGVTYSMDS